MKTVWDVRSALTSGIVEVEVLEIAGRYAKVKSDNPIFVNGWDSLGAGDWRSTREEALKRAERMRKDKIAALKKELLKLEEMPIAEHPMSHE